MKRLYKFIVACFVLTNDKSEYDSAVVDHCSTQYRFTLLCWTRIYLIYRLFKLWFARCILTKINPQYNSGVVAYWSIHYRLTLHCWTRIYTIYNINLELKRQYKFCAACCVLTNDKSEYDSDIALHNIGILYNAEQEYI